MKPKLTQSWCWGGDELLQKDIKYVIGMTKRPKLQMSTQATGFSLDKRK